MSIKSKPDQEREIRATINKIERLRDKAPANQQKPIDDAINYLDGAINNMDCYYDDRCTRNTVYAACGSKKSAAYTIASYALAMVEDKT